MKTATLSIIVVFILIAAVVIGGQDFEPNVRRTLADQGYTQVNLTGYQVFGCGRDDTYNTGFTAVNFAGHRVEGVVCGGAMKGMTVRTF